MHQIIFVTRRKPGQTLARYLEHYHTTRVQLAIKMPGLVSYRQMPIRHEGKFIDCPSVISLPLSLAQEWIQP